MWELPCAAPSSPSYTGSCAPFCFPAPTSPAGRRAGKDPGTGGQKWQDLREAARCGAAGRVVHLQGPPPGLGAQPRQRKTHLKGGVWGVGRWGGRGLPSCVQTRGRAQAASYLSKPSCKVAPWEREEAKQGACKQSGGGVSEPGSRALPSWLDSGAARYLGPVRPGAEAHPSHSGSSGTHGLLKSYLSASPSISTKVNETQRGGNRGEPPPLAHVLSPL